MGVLTAAAAEQARMVIGVEIDERLIPVLHDTLKEYDNIRIIKGDFLKTDIFELINQAKKDDKRGFSGVRLIGNLPYYITTPIIMKVLEEPGETSKNTKPYCNDAKGSSRRIRANRELKTTEPFQ